MKLHSSQPSFIKLVLLVFWATFLLGCADQEKFPSRPITLICPWAAGGGTDRVSRMTAVHLETELGVPVNVINATGGRGVTGHSHGLHARPDGYTVLLATVELNTMHWSGLTELTPAHTTPLLSINEDSAALIVRTDAPWQTLGELEAEIRGKPKQLTCSGTATGGIWHLALAGWLLSLGMEADDITFVSETGAGPSLRELISGGLDMVCCSLPEAGTLMKAGQVRALGLMAPERVKDYPDVGTFVEQGHDWSMGAWRGLLIPQNAPAEVTDVLVTAIQRMVTGQTQVTGKTFPESMKIEGFNNAWRPPEEFRRFMDENDAKFGELLSTDAMRSVNADRYHPMAFPGMIMGVAVVLLVGIIIQTRLQATSTASLPPALPRALDGERPDVNLANFVLFVLAIAAFPLLGDIVGFVIFSAVMLLVTFWWLGCRWWTSALIAVMLSPVVYQTFAHILRVPLPRGVLGW